MPQILRGSWFSWELGKPTLTVIDDISMSQRGECDSFVRDGADYTFVFKSLTQNCYHCVKTYPRTLNVFEKIESPCVTLEPGDEPTIERICRGINNDQQLITLFNENYIPINCRSSLEGVWQFAYQVNFALYFDCKVRVRERVSGCMLARSQKYFSYFIHSTPSSFEN